MTFLCRCKVPLFTYVLQDYAEVIKVLFYGILERPRPFWGFPSGSSGKEPICLCRRHERWDMRHDPCIRKIQWKRTRQPTAFILAWTIPWTEKPGELRSIVHRVTKSQTRLKWLSTHTQTRTQISSVKEFNTFLYMGRCKSLGSSKEVFWYASQLSGVYILCFHTLSHLGVHHWEQLSG